MKAVLKRSWILPVLQIFLAAGLFWLTLVLERASRSLYDMSEPDPAYLVLLAVNAPVDVARIVWDHWMPHPWDLAAGTAGVGLLWY
jgi:hypothetical protein